MMRRCAAFVFALLGVLVASASASAVDARQARAVAGFGASAVDERSGAPVFAFRGRPFFVYGAAFFYERLPRATWRSAMHDLKYRLHVNTLDLYVPWNWHELSNGDFDFDGRTNPRRDLREVLRLARQFDFALIVRPGPVIRNEWRNAGYPAWLLRRPEYGMPLRDRLEGRYPPTATLQNAHSDDAAAAWLRNATHRQYARRWLRAALREFLPVSRQVVAIALDDDQGAYIDNQTWPAPHLRKYLEWLRACVADVTGGRVPVFINTYQMKVTASSPVWAMGNWYQSDAFALGEHDRTQLEFSTGLLQTRPHQPVMASEFQAGWLQQPQDVLPAAAAPSNTLLALGTLIAMGARGVINFPAQDTVYPAGYEVPFANAFYAWDAALGYSGRASPRAAPTRSVGAEVATFNPLLAAARVAADAAIVSLPSAYDERHLTNADISALAERTMTAQRYCRRVRLTCELVDLRYAELAKLREVPLLLVPLPERGPLQGRSFVPRAARMLAAYRRSRGTAVLASAEPSGTALAAALARTRHMRFVQNADATFARDPRTGAGFLSLENYGGTSRVYRHVVVRSYGGVHYVLPRIAVAARAALLLPVGIPLRAYDAGFAAVDRFSATCSVVGMVAEHVLGATVGRVRVTFETGGEPACGFETRVARRVRSYVLANGTRQIFLDSRGRVTNVLTSAKARAGARNVVAARGTLPIRSGLLVDEPLRADVPATAARAYASDVYRDGEGAVTLENDRVRIVVSPRAGGRAFIFEDKARETNAFTTVGALRDDVATQPPLSSVDKIAKYTNQMPAGFFNRDYRTRILASGNRAVVRLSYDAPDAYPQGAHFDRTLALESHATCFQAALASRFDGTGELAVKQRAVSVTSLAVGDLRAPHASLITDRAQSLEQFAVATLPSERHAVGLFDATTHELALVGWDEAAGPVTLAGRKNSLLVRVVETPGVTTRLSFGYERATGLERATARVLAFERSGCADRAR